MIESICNLFYSPHEKKRILSLRVSTRLLWIVEFPPLGYVNSHYIINKRNLGSLVTHSNDTFQNLVSTKHASKRTQYLLSRRVLSVTKPYKGSFK